MEGREEGEKGRHSGYMQAWILQTECGIWLTF